MSIPRMRPEQLELQVEKIEAPVATYTSKEN